MNKALLLALGASTAYGMYRMKFYNSIRGLRNNNPGNIRENQRVDYDWEGEAIIDLDDEFEVFVSPEYGIRAMARILMSYRRRDVVTVSQIIHAWAPPEDDNDTEAYIKAVTESTRMMPNDEVVRYMYTSLVAGIIEHENGIQPFSREFIEQSVALA